ncbi:MAG: hypothetical protein A2X86_00685 [Bdellovibrionales bacterium GWA2_49_15]|nr:MAG: hypothetical protein A2X86_00685 [Bdellovibrionales bacterium GWA2_49_15]
MLICFLFVFLSSPGWGGVGSQLSDLGIDVSLVVKEEINKTLSGGVKKETVYLDNIDLKFAFDGDKLAGLKGSSAFLYILADHGGDPSTNVGDEQGTSNIETNADTARIYELWVQQLLLEDKVSVLFGVHDLNSEFYVTDTSGLFFNSSFGVGRELSQTGVNGPSIFPITAPAVRLRVDPTKSFYLQVGVFNGQSGDLNDPKGTHFRFNRDDGRLLISEAAYLREKGKYAIGTWAYTATFEHLTLAPERATSYGTYFLADQEVAKDISAFLRYGVASAEVNSVHSNLGAGVVFTGLLPSRESDRFGLALTKVTAGDEIRQAQEAAGEPIEKAETTFEANYRIELCSSFVIQPDLQYVTNPGLNPALDNAWVAATRLEFNF